MKEREIDTWLTTEISELSSYEEIFASGPGHMGTNLRLAMRARLMAETALTVVGVDTKKERHSLHQMLDQLRKSVSADMAEHLDNHYKDAITFYSLTGVPKTLRNYWHNTADSHIHYHMRYAPARSEEEKAQAAPAIDKVRLVLDVEMLRALHAILDPSWPQCSLPYAHLATVRGKHVVLDELVMAARGDDAYINWCLAYTNPMDVFWVEPSEHPNEDTAQALSEAMQSLKRYDDPAVLWLLLPFRQIEARQRQIDMWKRAMGLDSNANKEQRFARLIDRATERINTIRENHIAPKS